MKNCRARETSERWFGRNAPGMSRSTGSSFIGGAAVAPFTGSSNAPVPPPPRPPPSVSGGSRAALVDASLGAAASFNAGTGDITRV